MSLLRERLLCLVTVLVLTGLSNVSMAQKGGKPTTPSLTLAVSPSTILEGNTATGTVTHNNSNTSSAVTVTLSSSDTSEATVPASVTIPAGSNSATFTVTAVNDNTVDGDQSVTIAASASGYSAGSTTVTVSDKPIFEYRTEVIPAGNNSVGQVNGITNNGRVYGWMTQQVDGAVLYKSGFVYDQVSKIMYDLNQIASLTEQVDLLVGSNFGLNSIVGMNESGLMTGYVENNSHTIRYGVAIDTTVDGQFSSDPADWAIQLLPTFGSTYTYGRRINEFGDIVGIYHSTATSNKQNSVITYRAFLYNPWAESAPVELSVDLRGAGFVELNDLAQVAGVDTSNRAFLYDAMTDSYEFFTDANYQRVDGLNNSGVLSGQALIRFLPPRGRGQRPRLWPSGMMGRSGQSRGRSVRPR